jgi:hypothetical protein
MAVAYNKFNQFPEDLFKKVHNMSADTIKLALTNTAPVATNAILSDITQITAQNGYASGGPTITVSSCTQTSGTLKWILADVVVTASGGSIGPFRYGVIYNSTPTSPLKPLIGWYDYGSAVTLLDAESMTFDFDGSAGVLQAA